MKHAMGLGSVVLQHGCPTFLWHTATRGQIAISGISNHLN